MGREKNYYLFYIEAIFYQILINFFNILGEIVRLFGYELFPVSIKTVEYYANSAGKKFIKEEKNKISMTGIKIFLEDIMKSKQFSIVGKHTAARVIAHDINRIQEVWNLIETIPDVLDTNFSRPVFILSLPRTGTTFLHCLLSNDKRWKSPGLWESHQSLPIVYPLVPVSEKKFNNFTNSVDLMNYRLGDNFVKNHNVSVTDPEDLGELLIGEGLWCYMAEVFNLPNYMEFYQNLSVEDFAQAYSNIKKRLQVICRYQNMESKRFLLMLHFGLNTNFDALLRVFPDAQFIMIHRDLNDVIRSATSLYSYLQIEYKRSKLENKQYICDGLIERYLKDIEKMKIWRNSENFKNCNFKRIIDIKFQDLVKNPIQVVKDLYKDLNIDYNEICNKEFDHYIHSQKKHKYGQHKYQTVNIEGKLSEKADEYHRNYVL